MLRILAEFERARKLRALVFWAGILGLIWVLTGWILEERVGTLVLAGLGLTVTAIVLAILNNWRSGFYMFLPWLLFEDLARKYLGNDMSVYFAKDVLIGVTYISFFAALRRGQVATFRPRFLAPLLFFFWLGVIQMFNPSSPSLLYGLLGLKLYFYYVPLLFVSYALLRTEKDLHHFLVVNVGLAALVAVLGIIQAIVGPSFLNPPVLAPELRTLGHLYRHAPESGEVLYRPTSVFVSDGRFAWYLILAWIMSFGAAGYLLLRTRRGRTLIFLCIALVTAAVVLSGSRGTLMWTAGSACVLVAALLWGAPWRWQQGHRLLAAVRRVFLLAALSVYCLLIFFPSAIGARWAFYSETLSPRSPQSELLGRTWDYPVRNLSLAFAHPQWPYGYGIGTASLGVQYVSRFFGAGIPGVGVESGYGTLVVELGILGLILWVVWTFALIWSGWQVVRRLRATPYFPVAFSILWFAVLLLVGFTYVAMAPYQNYVFNAYFWLLVGILFRLPALLSLGPAWNAAGAGAQR